MAPGSFADGIGSESDIVAGKKTGAANIIEELKEADIGEIGNVIHPDGF